MEFNKKWLTEVYELRADDATPAINNNIPVGAKMVKVSGVVNDANDWVYLPDALLVPEGFEIIILCAAGGNFELRTPASSNQKINNEDADGTKEYLCTDTDVVRAVKMGGTAGWSVQSITNLGAVRTAVVPD